MQIRTLKVVEYRKNKVYVRNFGSTFEYLVFIDGDLYGTHLTVSRTIGQFLLGRDYTEQQLADTVRLVLKMAEASVDYVLDKPSG